MKAKRAAIVYLLITVVVLTSFSFNLDKVHADISVPEIIRIGLGYGQSQGNLFSLESETGLRISKFENSKYTDLLELKAPASLKIRRDEYYNIIGGTECEINFVKAAKYEGEVVGPYHIQVGDIYPDAEAAGKILKQVSSITPSAFLAYDEGWRVWAQLYIDEKECLRQIEVMKNEIGNLAYSVVIPDKKRIQVIDSKSGQLLLMLNSENKVKITPCESKGNIASISYKGKKYRGSITLQSLEGSNLTLVNELPFDQYLYSVVPSEMPTSWHMEALKAQAVAARNYALATMGKHNAHGFDLCSSVHCQAYNGLEKENVRTTEAVDDTKGKILTYNGKLITTFFHSSSGGHTEDSENIWGAKTDYIRGVDDKYSLGSPYDNWSIELDRAEIKEKLTQAGINLGDIVDIRIIEVSNYGRVTKLEIKGTKETQLFEREKIRSILGTTVLKSIWYKLRTDADVFVRGSLADTSLTGRASGMYVVSASGKAKVSSPVNRIMVKGMSSTKTFNMLPNKYIFDGRGFGHGLGMSQYGAKGMAEAGNNYQKILEHYYKGAKVQ